MTIHLDTSVLVAAFTGARPAFTALTRLVTGDHRLGMSTIALYEWERGPRSPDELDVQRAIVPPDGVCEFGEAEALLAGSLYRAVSRARGRDLDLAIAACAITHDAVLWTLNRKDFADIPGLRLL